ncbi:MAG: hypothetical protein UT34_C0002G0137 [candidate division WS6 bacterium GW2011_GWF2_39_15]|uniref:Uncharacterized protein n=1 Tax=candidate division WS6 bacterium GW2011_GWF2_39_15 TaxID=1619100 RepID=A0A0G0Q5F4_9BACT|nr:MAG: hypothetical protein UT34_C0002G0137 [candidate division WS6 bacterium GW2011_GWF2_39_15]
MAGKRKAEYEDALQSIYDFIFKNNKNKGRLRPGRISGAAASDKLAAALAEIASKPGFYASDVVMNSIGQSIGSPEWIRLWTDKLNVEKFQGADDSAGRLRVKNIETAKLITNPRKYVAGAYASAKAEREWARKVGFAGYIDGAVALLWAKKNGMSWGDAAKLSAAASFELQPIHREEASRMFAETAAYETFKGDKNKAYDAAKDLYKAIGSSALTRGGKVTAQVQTIYGGSKQQYLQDFLSKLKPEEQALLQKGQSGQKFEDMRDSDKYRGLVTNLKKYESAYDRINQRYNELAGHLSKVRDTSGQRLYSDNDIKDLLNSYSDSKDLSKLGELGVSSKDVGKYLGNVHELNPTIYRRLINRNLHAKMMLQDPDKDMDEIKKIQQGMSVVGLWQRTHGEGLDYSVLHGQIANELKSASLSNTRKTQLQNLQKQVESFQQEHAKMLGPSKMFGYMGMGKQIPNTAGMKKSMDNYLKAEYNLWDFKLKDLQTKISQGATLTDAERKDYSEARKMISLLDVERSQLKSLPWAGNRIVVGQLAGMFRAYQGLMKGELGNQLVNGMFWATDGGNPLAPGEIGGIRLALRKGKGEYDTQDFGGVVVSRDNIHQAYSRMAAMYYLSPGSLMKTFFWNGEGLAFLSSINQERAAGMLNLRKDKIAEVLGLSQEDLSKKMGSNFLSIIDALRKSKDSRAKGLLKGAGFASDVSTFTGSWARFYNMNVSGVYNRMNGRIKEKIMGGIGKLLAGKIKSEIWNDAVSKFVAGAIGIKQMIRAGIEALLQAANVSTGGTMTLVIGFLANVATEALYSVSKPLMELAAGLVSAIVFFALILLFFGFVFLTQGFGIINSPYRSIIPSTCAACADYNPDSGLYEGIPSEDGTGFPSSNSSCPFTFEPAICTQGDGGNSSSYHQSHHAIDIGTNSVNANKDIWHAPADGKVTLYRASNICASTGKDYGGWLEFADNAGNVYTILHVRALVGVGPVKKGTALAVTRRDLTNDGSCWTGPHFHLHVSAKGSYVNSEDWYRNKLKCSFSPCP